jgi:hypothetical protein
LPARPGLGTFPRQLVRRDEPHEQLLPHDKFFVTA